MRTRQVASLMVAGCLIFVVSCGDNLDSGQSSGSNQSSSSSVVSPILPVQNPRDVAAMAGRTCELLTTQQVRGFGLDLSPLQSDGLFGTVDCEWRTTTSDRRVVKRLFVSVFINNPTLEVVYNRRDGFASFELTAIEGYPATVTRSNANLPVCSVDVKAAERQSVTVTYRSDEFDNDPQQACVVGKQVAEAVLMNLPLKT